ncbi:hypothetical protein JCM11251_007111 [Rhodosporidiobolus azoricus]
MESNAFNDAFTTTHGGSCFFVSVDPAFDTQVAEAASLVARSLPADTRNDFTSSLVEAARAALPPAAPPAQDDDADEEELKKAADTPETVEKKREVVKQVLAALKDQGGNKLDGVQSDREFEGWSNLVLSLSLSLLEGDDLASAVSTLTTTYVTLPSSASSSSPSSPVPSLPARYTALATLFNALPSSLSTAKLETLTALVSFAASNDDAPVLAPTLASLPAIFAALSLPTPADADKTVLALAQALASHGAREEARRVLESHLSQKGQAHEQTAEKGQLADLFVALSLAAPTVYDLAPLASLPSPPASPALAKLLSLFLTGDLSSFSSFDFSSLPAIEGASLEKDVLEKKIRLVKLAELCAERVGETVSYKEIQETLGLDQQSGEDEGEEVETWVIDAIRASLLSGRLSQPSQSLSITRALPPSSSSTEGKLDAKYWKVIEERLEGWKDRLGRVGESARRAAGGVNGTVAGREERNGRDEE